MKRLVVASATVDAQAFLRLGMKTRGFGCWRFHRCLGVKAFGICLLVFMVASIVGVEVRSIPGC